MKKTTKDPATGRKKSSTKDSKEGEVMGNDKYMQFEATKQYLMSTGQLDGKTDEYINAYVENWIIGYAKGMKEGRAEGELSKALQIARNMKNKGLPISDISEMTGLGVDEIEKL